MHMNKLRIGDMVVVAADLAYLTHDSRKSQIAEVVGIYPHFFNVKYEEGYQQSIQYKDISQISKLSI